MYRIKYIGDPVLRKETAKVEVFDEKFQSFIQEMTDIMYREDGIGLAAPQIGVSKKVLVIDVGEIAENEKLRVFVNPEILDKSGEKIIEEGCLSIPGVREEVSRPEIIRVKYQDENGEEFEKEYDGWPARVIQHEMDHLNGVLFVDYLSPLKKQLLISKKLIPERY